MRPDHDPGIARGVRALEYPNRKLTRLAEKVARLARPLLSSPHMFIGVEGDASGELCLTWWGPDYHQVARISALPPGFCPAESAEGQMQNAAAALLAYLAGRWPVPPQRLGAITDGTGVAFAPDRPSLSEPGWLLHNATRPGELVAILPLDPSGACALLDARSASVH